MNKFAEKLSVWFGSTPFILFHIAWFTVWMVVGLPMEALTLIVSLEAIFLSLFILRAENVQNGRNENLLKAIKQLNKQQEDDIRQARNAARRMEDKLKRVLKGQEYER